MTLEHFLFGIASVMVGCLLLGLGITTFASTFLFSLRVRWIAASIAMIALGFGLMVGSLFIR